MKHVHEMHLMFHTSETCSLNNRRCKITKGNLVLIKERKDNNLYMTQVKLIQREVNAINDFIEL